MPSGLVSVSNWHLSSDVRISMLYLVFDKLIMSYTKNKKKWTLELLENFSIKRLCYLQVTMWFNKKFPSSSSLSTVHVQWI